MEAKELKTVYRNDSQFHLVCPKCAEYFYIPYQDMKKRPKTYPCWKCGQECIVPDIK